MTVVDENDGNFKKIEHGSGRRFDIAGAKFTWKVRNENTDNSFSIYEMTLQPGEGVPLHYHPYVEVFYILDGEIEFLRRDNVTDNWVPAIAGETIIVPTNGLHAFYNRTRAPARLLNVANQLHQPFFDALDDLDRSEPFSDLPVPEAMIKVGSVAANYSMHFQPFDPPSVKKA